MLRYLPTALLFLILALALLPFVPDFIPDFRGYRFVQGSGASRIVYAGLLLAFLAFGSFGAVAIVLSFKLPPHVRLWALVAGTVATVLQYLLVAGDLSQYGAPWFWAVFLPAFILREPLMWSGVAEIVTLVIPALLMLSLTAAVPVVWLLYARRLTRLPPN